ncbi:helix-turn-helix domain-containing protein [Longimycelium tulufanense]|uniref:helix-turn-helix domain-containing protein n=1 Tax=Longimycelium tulufanense TaxID=907463 RepID=UPI00166A6F59|nr:helix-turn-helix domain-containing protein [Longimycelium tulufanense]
MRDLRRQNSTGSEQGAEERSIEERRLAWDWLVHELQKLKREAGLSYAQMEARLRAKGTPYSDSSLERYINGKVLPPRGAVKAIGELCGGDSIRLLGLWELARTSKSGNGGTGLTVGANPGAGSVASASEGSDDHPVRWRLATVLIVASSSGVVIVLVLVMMMLLTWNAGVR